MKAIARSCTLLLLGLALPLLSACGTTAVVESHPSLARAGDGNAAKVYFLRPDIGYHGVQRNAFSLSLNDKELLTLATGEYALVYLEPVSGAVTVESWTVKMENLKNYMTKVKRSRPFSFDAGKTYFVAFEDPDAPKSMQEAIAKGMAAGVLGSSDVVSFAPILITATEAIEAANRTKPVGRALQEPIAQSKQRKPSPGRFVPRGKSFPMTPCPPNKAIDSEANVRPLGHKPGS